jgi:hypothetical protein
LKRAWHTVWNYRTLWIFGVILALTTTSWSGAMGYDRSNNQDEYREGTTVVRRPGETFSQALHRTMREEIEATKREIAQADRELDKLFAEVLHVNVKSDLHTVITMLAWIIVIAYIVTKIARYVGETALIRMVDETEQTGKRQGVRQGFRMGWSRSAWRLFLIDVLINVSLVLAAILLFTLAFGHLPLWAKGSGIVIFTGVLFTVGLFFLAVCLVIVASVALSLVKRFAWRACVLGKLGVIASIRQGYAVVRQHLKDAGLVWLITAGVRLGWGIAMVPVVFLLLGAGTVLGGLSEVLVGGVAGLALAGETPVFLALAVGVSIFLLVLVAPLAFLGGLREVFLSSTWTLTYRELRPVEASEKESQRMLELNTSGLEVASVA